ncbi:uncharacterized protein VTP21DRAFT_5810 [Calcarisporiella thermophila]|uniref:uncharacterized protein n=1 Tax=Calcarisporiella thermophila TaxID=911321 RepID=UPI003743862A
MDEDHYHLNSTQIWSCKQYVKLIAISCNTGAFKKGLPLQSQIKRCDSSYCGDFADTIVVDNFELGVNGVAGLILRDDQRKAIVVAFRGAESLPHFLLIVSVPFLKPYPNPAANGARYSRIADIFRKLFKRGITPQIRELIQSYPDYEIEIIGQSFGAIAAVVQTLDIIESIDEFDMNKLKCITLSEPRVGDQKFVDYFESFPIFTKRLVNSRDWAPHLPYKFMGFRVL